MFGHTPALAAQPAPVPLAQPLLSPNLGASAESGTRFAQLLLDHAGPPPAARPPSPPAHAEAAAAAPAPPGAPRSTAPKPVSTPAPATPRGRPGDASTQAQNKPGAAAGLMQAKPSPAPTDTGTSDLDPADGTDPEAGAAPATADPSLSEFSAWIGWGSAAPTSAASAASVTLEPSDEPVDGGRMTDGAAGRRSHLAPVAAATELAGGPANTARAGQAATRLAGDPDADAGTDAKNPRSTARRAGEAGPAGVSARHSTPDLTSPADRAQLQGPSLLRETLPAATATVERASPDSFNPAMALSAAVPGAPAAPLGAADHPTPTSRLMAPLHSSDFGPELAASVSLWAADGVQSAQLQLNPAEMGPVAVQIVLDGSQAQVSFHASHAQTRQALEQSLPDLAAALQSSGLTLSGGGVFQQAPREQQAAVEDDARASRSARPNADRRGAGGITATPQAPRRSTGLLDTFA